MARVKFYLDIRGVKAGNSAPLKIKITSKGIAGYIPLDIRLSPSQWNDRKERILAHPQEKTLNLFIRKKLIDVEEIVRELPVGMDGRQMMERVKVLLNSGSEMYQRENLFYTIGLKFSNSRNSERTREIYNQTLKAIANFDPMVEYKTFEEINVQWLTRFDEFLQKTSPSVNARGIHFRNIRAIFNYAIKDLEITSFYPFHKFKIKKAETAKRSLTIEQVRELFSGTIYEPIRHDDAMKLHRYVDMFKLSLFLRGIRPVDLFYLKKSDVINGRIEYTSRKCGTHYSVKLEPEALEIIDRYSSKFEYLVDLFDHHQSKNGYKQFFKQQNQALQNIGKTRTHKGRGGGQLEGVSQFPGITAYWARHTWATLAIELGYSMETVSAGLGHLHGEEMTLVYVAFRQKAVDECNRALIDYVLGMSKKRNKIKVKR